MDLVIDAYETTPVAFEDAVIFGAEPALEDEADAA
jgi:hypothetical protein